MSSPERGEVWLVDLGYTAKVIIQRIAFLPIALHQKFVEQLDSIQQRCER